MLSGDVLRPEHRRQLEIDSAIPAELIAEEGIRSISSTADLPTPSADLGHPAPDKGRRFGKRPQDVGGGILFPIRDARGNLTYQFKPDQPRLRDGSPVKYESPPGVRNVVFVPKRIQPFLDRRDRILWVTEGVKKTLAGVGVGLCIVGLTGVDNWKMRLSEAVSVPLPDFDQIQLEGRVVVICYDSDWRSNANVAGAVDRLRRFLQGWGATVLVADIPPSAADTKQGLDDYIAAGGSVDVLLVDAIRRRALEDQLARPTGRVDDPAACDGNCATSSALRERLREHKVADSMRRTQAFSGGEIEVARAYCRAAASALSRRETRTSVWSKETARLTGQSPATTTRFHKEYQRFQDDPEVRSTLPFLLEHESRLGKDHVYLVVPDPPTDPAERSTAGMLLKLSHLSRRPTRQRQGVGRWTCPNPDHANAPVIMETTRVYRCAVDACDETWAAPTTVVRRRPDAAVSVDEDPVPSAAEIHDAPDVAEAQAEAQDFSAGPFQHEINGASTFHRQTGTTPATAVTFVTADDSAALSARAPTVMEGGERRHDLGETHGKLESDSNGGDDSVNDVWSRGPMAASTRGPSGMSWQQLALNLARGADP